MAALVPFSEALRLAVGDALDALSSAGGHHELGFSSFEAYARERCERTGRWAADTRALARRLRGLPRTREELESGNIGWSTAELLARHVTPESECEWLEKARRATVRELRALLAVGAERADEVEDEPTCTLTVTATREDGFMFEGARKVAAAVLCTDTSAERLLQALLAEGYSTLLELVPEAERAGLYEMDGLERDLAAQAKAHANFCSLRRHWREEAEELCETRVASLPEFELREVDEVTRAALVEGHEALDREIRRLCAELSERDLALGIVAESARKTEVWRRLGFASEAQYARERVGVSLSSLKAKRILAARAGRVPELASALASGRVGYEAAYLLSRVVTRETVEEWLGRAERRTVKHLREEVEAAELLVRMGQARDQRPLDEGCLGELFELERSIVSGDLLEGRAVDAQAGDCANARGRAGQMSGTVRVRGGVRSFGRVTMRWCVTEKTQRFFRALERVFARVRTRVCRGSVSFLRFLCENFCRIWLPVLRRERLTENGEEPEYFGVYGRDAFRCTSPVCTRRDVTPHHLVFRSRGGGDEDENVASLCVWCHLHGVHEGRIVAEPPASRIRWRIGRSGTLTVEGRKRC